ncbi:hypothetical protein R5R35_002676 [Gryllus longicercus]|uniref:Moesin/ezrin/radixin homolog 1 n=1 Tax=Gryllus longicercus TaxID=2509291 RepID=A0AAN9ZGG4_9ORTH
MLKFGSKSDINVVYKCTVRLLEDTEIVECEFQCHHKGKYLLEQVCQQLNLAERDHFGLRYVDIARQRHWLDPAKTVLKQVKDMDPILFSFRVKFYPPDPFRLKEEITRYQIYLQLKRDLLHGRLYCTAAEAALLAAYIIQAELGDYDPEEHGEGYVSEFKLLLKQTSDIEQKIAELHQTQMKGQTPGQTETSFLRKACQLDTYGVDPHPVKDHRGSQLYLGINHCGILTFQGSRKTNHFKWNEVQKINYEGKMFIVHLTYNEKKHTVGFKCPTGAACRHVWRCAIEQMLFFTLPSSSDAPTVVTGGSFFSWGTKFRYSGRVEKEILEDSSPLRKEEPAINRSLRSSSLRRKAASVPATPSTPVGSELGYGSLPRANHSTPMSDSRLHDASGALLLDSGPLSSPYCPDNTLPLLEPVAEDQEIAAKLRDEVESFIKHECGDALLDAPSEVLTEEVDGLMSGTKIGETSHGFDDYYFRDSFDHSSSESQLVDTVIGGKPGVQHLSPSVGGGGLSHRSTPVSRGRAASKLSLQAPVPATATPGPAPASGSPRRFNLLQVFVPSFLFVALSLAVGAVLVLESDCEVLSSVRQWPEMVTLRQEYYEPAKEYVRQRFAKFFW